LLDGNPIDARQAITEPETFSDKGNQVSKQFIFGHVFQLFATKAVSAKNQNLGFVAGYGLRVG
jgi:hypothetical protein